MIIFIATHPVDENSAEFKLCIDNITPQDKKYGAGYK